MSDVKKNKLSKIGSSVKRKDIQENREETYNTRLIDALQGKYFGMNDESAEKLYIDTGVELIDSGLIDTLNAKTFNQDPSLPFRYVPFLRIKVSTVKPEYVRNFGMQGLTSKTPIIFNLTRNGDNYVDRGQFNDSDSGEVEVIIPKGAFGLQRQVQLSPGSKGYLRHLGDIALRALSQKNMSNTEIQVVIALIVSLVYGGILPVSLRTESLFPETNIERIYPNVGQLAVGLGTNDGTIEIVGRILSHLSNKKKRMAFNKLVNGYKAQFNKIYNSSKPVFSNLVKGKMQALINKMEFLSPEQKARLVRTFNQAETVEEQYDVYRQTLKFAQTKDPSITNRESLHKGFKEVNGKWEQSRDPDSECYIEGTGYKIDQPDDIDLVNMRLRAKKVFNKDGEVKCDTYSPYTVYRYLNGEGRSDVNVSFLSNNPLKSFLESVNMDSVRDFETTHEELSRRRKQMAYENVEQGNPISTSDFSYVGKKDRKRIHGNGKITGREHNIAALFGLP